MSYCIIHQKKKNNKNSQEKINESNFILMRTVLFKS